MLRLMRATVGAGVLIVAIAQPAAAQGAPSASRSAPDGAGATMPTAITIETTRLGPFGLFQASGAISDSGTFAVSNPVFGGPGPGRFVNVHSTETFTGTAGTFTLVRNVRVTWGDDPSVRTIDGNWEVVAGTGAYEDLHAQGKISGTVEGFPPAETFVLTYSGMGGTD